MDSNAVVNSLNSSFVVAPSSRKKKLEPEPYRQKKRIQLRNKVKIKEREKIVRKKSRGDNLSWMCIVEQKRSSALKLDEKRESFRFYLASTFCYPLSGIVKCSILSFVKCCWHMTTWSQKTWHFNSEIIKTVPLKRKSKKITIIFEQFNYLHTHTRGNRNGMDVSYKSPQIIWTGTIIWCNISSISVRVYGMVDDGEKTATLKAQRKRNWH